MNVWVTFKECETRPSQPKGLLSLTLFCIFELTLKISNKCVFSVFPLLTPRQCVPLQWRLNKEMPPKNVLK